MPKKNIIRTTRIKCSTDGLFHKVEFHPDGSVLSNGCQQVAQEAERIAGMLRLGKAPADPGTCACLVALVLYGCEIILRREPNGDGDQPLDGWRDIYVRFETNKLVEKTMDSWRRKLRTERKRYAATEKERLKKATDPYVTMRATHHSTEKVVGDTVVQMFDGGDGGSL